MQKDKLEKLASERSNPCVTISMNTHRNFSDNQKDIVEFQKLIKKANDHVVKEFGHFDIKNLLNKIENIQEEIDFNSLLDSLHILLSDTTTEIVKSSWPTRQNVVSVAENFVIKPLIKDFNRDEDYLIMVLSQSDVRLLHAINDSIVGEISDKDFPFDKNPHFLTDQDKAIDSKQIDNYIREFFNNIDKVLVKIQNKTDMNIVVICTESNWSQLMRVADKPSIYFGNVSLNFNNSNNLSLATESWKIVSEIKKEMRVKAIHEMKEAAGHGKVLTDLAEIFLAVQSGRGDLLITHEDYHQAVIKDGQNSFHLAKDVTLPGVIDDITSEMAWEVISKKGRAIFTNSEEFKSFGKIALKVRY